MTHRSILTGKTPNVVVRASGDVSIEGWNDDRVAASTDSRWGLKVEQRSASAIGRVRARAGDRVLLDVQLDAIGWIKKSVRGEVTQVHIGGSGQVHVPPGSSVEVYAGKSVEARDIRGSVAVYAGGDVRLRHIHTLVHVSAGGAMDLDCETIAGDDLKFASGRDLRFYIHDLTDAKIMVDDLGGYWEGIIGAGRRKIRLKAGGDVTLVTDQEVKGQPPHYVLGKIEKPTRTDDAEATPSETRGDSDSR
jgi:hypothetical protein